MVLCLRLTSVLSIYRRLCTHHATDPGSLAPTHTHKSTEITRKEGEKKKLIYYIQTTHKRCRVPNYTVQENRKKMRVAVSAQLPYPEWKEIDSGCCCVRTRSLRITSAQIPSAKLCSSSRRTALSRHPSSICCLCQAVGGQ